MKDKLSAQAGRALIVALYAPVLAVVGALTAARILRTPKPPTAAS